VALLATNTALAAQGAVPTQQLELNYEAIKWTYDSSRLERDFRRAVAANGLRISDTEIAGAAATASALIMLYDDWESPVTVFRGCGPSRELCFVIACRECSSGK
jgi:hypothetical protein